MTLSIADVAEDPPHTRDALATWLLGHTERISFGTPRRAGQRLVVDAIVHAECKYLKVGSAPQLDPGQEPEEAEPLEHEPTPQAWCAAHGFAGVLPPDRPRRPAARQHVDGTFSIVHRGGLRQLQLAQRPAARRGLPVLNGENPCAGAPCRTADNRRGAACCRDLTLEIVAPAYERQSDQLEALLRARRSPYLCKVERTDADIIECELISACGYLGADGVGCVLHDRVRPDGRPAKPRVCSRWPDLGPDDVGHPGCRLVPNSVRGET